MGVIDDESILPEEETVSALIVYGYEDGHAETTQRKDVDEIRHFAGK